MGSWIRFSKMLTSMLLKHLCLLCHTQQRLKTTTLVVTNETPFIESPFIIPLSTSQPSDSPPKTLTPRGPSCVVCGATHPPGTGQAKEIFGAPVAPVRSTWVYSRRVAFSALSRGFYFTGHTDPTLVAGRGHALHVLTYQYPPSLC